MQRDYATDFPTLLHLSNYNHRRKRLDATAKQVARLWSRQLCPHKDTIIVDSIPIPVAHIAREYSTTVCRKQFHTAPDKGYSAVLEQYFIGYKLHMVVSLMGSITSWN